MLVSVALKKSFLLVRAVRGCLLGLQSLTVGCSGGVDLGPKAARTALSLWILCKGNKCGINTCCAPSSGLGSGAPTVYSHSLGNLCIWAGGLSSVSHRRQLRHSRGGWAPGLWIHGPDSAHHSVLPSELPIPTSSFLTCLSPHTQGPGSPHLRDRAS